MWRNPGLTYLAGTDYLANLVGFKHGTGMIGINDHNLRCKAVELADVVTKTATPCASQTTQMAGGFYMQTDSGYDKEETNKILALVTADTDISHQPILSMGVVFNQVLRKKSAAREGFYVSIDKTYQKCSLTPRQSQCLLYSLYGYA